MKNKLNFICKREEEEEEKEKCNENVALRFRFVAVFKRIEIVSAMGLQSIRPWIWLLVLVVSVFRFFHRSLFIFAHFNDMPPADFRTVIVVIVVFIVVVENIQNSGNCMCACVCAN